MFKLLLLLSLGVIINGGPMYSNIAFNSHDLNWLYRLYQRYYNQSQEQRTVCTSEKCKFIAKLLKASMNDTADPCNDFFDYACGNTNNFYFDPEDENTWTIANIAELITAKRLKELLKFDKNPNDSFTMKLAKKWYDTCVDEEQMEKKGVEPLLTTLWRFGGWPLIMKDGEWNNRIYTWQFVDDLYATLTGMNAFHDVRVGLYTWDESDTDIVIDAPTLPRKFSISSLGATDSFSSINFEYDDDDDENEDVNEKDNDEIEVGKKEPIRRKIRDRWKHDKVKNRNGKRRNGERKTMINEEQKENKIRNCNVGRRITEYLDGDKEDNNSKDENDQPMDIGKYSKYILNVSLELAKARDVEVPLEKLKRSIDDLIQFELKLEKITKLKKKILLMPQYCFQITYDSFEPKTSNGKVNWLKKVENLLAIAGLEMNEDWDIEMLTCGYIKSLCTLLDETPSETIVNYVHWNFISKMITTTTKSMRNLHRMWNGSEEGEDDWEQKCYEDVAKSDIITFEYGKKYLTDKLVKTATDMMEDIQKEVENQIKESKWLNDETKQFLFDKLKCMKTIIGIPDWYHNDTVVKLYFEGLSMGSSYFENILNYMRFHKWSRLRKLSEKDFIRLQYTDPRTSDAFFEEEKNSIAFSVAEFQRPHLDYKRPSSINFALSGSILGHEVNHAFDPTGHLFDKDGNFVEWESEMANEYNKRAECFVNQFNKYDIFPTKNIAIENYGNQTANENIADTMGLLSAYKAYKQKQRECDKPDDALPGLEGLTNDQIFFLSYAKMWCEYGDPDVDIVKRETHTSGRLRIIGTLSNSVDFAEAFNCPIGSPMNPKEKCNIWE